MRRPELRVVLAGAGALAPRLVAFFQSAAKQAAPAPLRKRSRFDQDGAQGASQSSGGVGMVVMQGRSYAVQKHYLSVCTVLARCKLCIVAQLHCI